MSFSSFDLRASSLATLASQDKTHPTPIQFEAIPALLDGQDIVGQAQTGSGKTLAFSLPMVEICDPDDRSVQGLVLVPTRELAIQVAGVISDLARPAGLSVAVLYGGVGYNPQIEALKKGAQIVVATPGRLLDHMQRGALSLSQLQFLVLDEADQMLDKGFAPDVERIISRTPSDRQTALFSATTPSWVQTVAAKHLYEPVFLKVEAAEAEPDIEHSIIEAWGGDKLPILTRLLNQPTTGATLVFGRTRHGVTNLAKRLRGLGYQVEALQGDLGQQARERIVQKFRSGELSVLLATNVAARGLDMLNIERVINYDLPETSELFVHRVGRTGRMGRSGHAYTIITATDLSKMQEIERHLGRKLPRLAVDKLGSHPAPERPAPESIQPRPAQTASASGDARRRRRRPRGQGQAPALGAAVI